MFAEIILHRRVPSKFATFTYAIPDGLALNIGQIVTVPFKNQNIPGVVWAVHKNPPSYKTREIASASDTRLTPQQIELIKWMSQKYEGSLSAVIDLFIPEKVWNS